jgi:hypothetical protein
LTISEKDLIVISEGGHGAVRGGKCANVRISLSAVFSKLTAELRDPFPSYCGQECPWKLVFVRNMQNSLQTDPVAQTSKQGDFKIGTCKKKKAVLVLLHSQEMYCGRHHKYTLEHIIIDAIVAKERSIRPMRTGKSVTRVMLRVVLRTRPALTHFGQTSMTYKPVRNLLFKDSATYLPTPLADASVFPKTP